MGIRCTLSLPMPVLSVQSSPRVRVVRCYVCRSRGQFIRALESLSPCQAWTMYQMSLEKPCTSLVTILPRAPLGRGCFLHCPYAPEHGSAKKVGSSSTQKIMWKIYQLGEIMKSTRCFAEFWSFSLWETFTYVSHLVTFVLANRERLPLGFKKSLTGRSSSSII